MKYWRKYTVQRECIKCGKLFECYKYNITKGWGNFCSRSCSKKDEGKRLGKLPKTDEIKKKISETLKRKYRNGELISPLVSLGIIGKRGEGSPNWQGGKSKIGQYLRRTLEYKEWHKKVLERDNYTCQFCGVRGGKLEVDHIKLFSKYPKLRLSEKNGRTLCVPCHKIRTYAKI